MVRPLRNMSWWRHQMETFSVYTGPLWGEFTGHWWIPLTMANDAELWCFLWSSHEQHLFNKSSCCQWFEMLVDVPMMAASLMGPILVCDAMPNRYPNPIRKCSEWCRSARIMQAEPFMLLSTQSPAALWLAVASPKLDHVTPNEPQRNRAMEIGEH